MRPKRRVCFLYIDNDHEKMIRVKTGLEETHKTLTVDLAFNLKDGFTLLSHHEYAIIAINIFLSEANPLQLLSSIRKTAQASILAIVPDLSAEDMAACFDSGADFVLTKHSEACVFEAYFRAFYRRHTFTSHLDAVKRTPMMVFGERLMIDPDCRGVYRDGASVRLTVKEYDLLYLLARNAGQVLSAAQILLHIWNDDAGNDSAVRNVITRLRQKIEPNPQRPTFIHTVFGMGYKLLSNPVEACDILSEFDTSLV